MLEYLHVKNLALIKDLEMTLSDNLNILSGETGAGKSILLGSINLALGQKASKELIRTGTDYAYVELIFTVTKDLEEKLAALDVRPEEGRLIISRRITEGKSLAKINGETVTAAMLKSVSELLIDIHGQHEHQSLLKEENHLIVLDSFGKAELKEAKDAYLLAYRAYREKKEEVKALAEDPEAMKRQMDFLAYQIDEIREADLKKNEEEALIDERNRLSHGQILSDTLSEILEKLSGRASDDISEAVRLSESLEKIDPSLRELHDELAEIEALISDAGTDAANRKDRLETDEGRLDQVEERLELIRKLEKKYGPDIPAVLKRLADMEAELANLERLDANREKILLELEEKKKDLILAARHLRCGRMEAAERFSKKMVSALSDLNFLEVRFQAEIRETTRYTASGADECVFMISTNPGEPMKPLSKVASGGELSRIMLAIRTLTAGSDRIHTLIFDEIDTGISGRTAAAVAEKMRDIAADHQVICISHLPQIVAMADHHFLIEKREVQGETVTGIYELSEEDSDRELARLLGTGEITDAVLQHAREMRQSLKSGRGEV